MSFGVHDVRRRIDDLAMAARSVRDVPRYLRHPVTLDGARQRVQARLASREARLLTMARRHIYDRSASPYLALLRSVGCEYGDLRALVERNGVEAALRRLADLGVYVTFDELKGRREVVRGSRRFLFRESDFDNVLVPAHFPMYTSGTGGVPGRVRRSLAFMRETADSVVVALDAHRLHAPHHVYWLSAPISKLVYFAMLGQPADAWFYPVAPRSLETALGSELLRLLARLGGYRLPQPTFLDLNRPELMVAWLARRPPVGQLAITTTVSSAVRTAAVACKAGVALNGVSFLVQGEPLTAARAGHITAAGARVIPNYGAVEIVTACYGCAAPSTADDVHLFEDRFAAITRRRRVGNHGPEVEALLFTSLSPISSKIYLNAETGDYARVEQRACDCPLGRFGMRTHLSEIRSFEKLTGEGMTVVGTNVLHVLGEVLPARFGGTATDYQLVELEGADSVTQLVLRVDPSIGALDDDLVRAVLLDEIGRGTKIDAYMTAIWRQAGTVRVSREPPLTTRSGKILPFHLVRARTDV